VVCVLRRSSRQFKCEISGSLICPQREEYSDEMKRYETIEKPEEQAVHLSTKPAFQIVERQHRHDVDSRIKSGKHRFVVFGQIGLIRFLEEDKS